MNVFNPSKVKVNSSSNCDHCGNPFSQHDYNNNEKGSSGWLYWF